MLPIMTLVWHRFANTPRNVGWIVSLLAIPLGIWLMSIPVLSAFALSGSIITVCTAGPPTCDYQTIQEGVNAATDQDTVLVSSGAYTGPITLKSNITLRSSDGPEATVLAANEGPIVVAGNVVSTTVQGFTISGQNTVSTAVGLELSDSDITVSDCIVRDLQGASGHIAAPDGEIAMAIWVTGTGALTVTGTTIQDIAGGDGLNESNGGAIGGDGVGIWVNDSSGQTIVVADTVIRRLRGGAAGSYEYWSYGCYGTGGRAIGIHTDSGANLIVSHSEITTLVGGMPCQSSSQGCIERAGAVIGIEGSGGTITLHDSLLSDLTLYAADGTVPSYAVHSSHTSGTHLERNTITSLSAKNLKLMEPGILGPESPICRPPSGTVVAVASESDELLLMENNSLNGISGTGPGGQAFGVLAKDVEDVTLLSNAIARIAGGSSQAAYTEAITTTALGLWIQHADAVEISANKIGEIQGGSIASYGYDFGQDGGGAVGIRLTAITEATVTNNLVWSLTGGRGTDHPPSSGYFPQGDDGGDATALTISGGSARVQNNTFYEATAGLGGDGDPKGQPGTAVGLRLMGDAEVLAINNAVISHGTGISSTPSATVTLDYNDLWDNRAGYQGVTPGANDLCADPAFVDPERSDFHLSADSPLIDAGTNMDAPDEDFEQEPRPLDGNDDGTSIADIGADEYWAGLQGSTKTVDQVVAAPGDRLTYQLTLVNSSILHDLVSARLTDTIPRETTYIDGSLWGSGGTYGYANDVITWTGTVSAGCSVTLTFSVTVDDDLIGVHAITNRAVLDDQIGIARTVQANTLVNPLRHYLPLALVSSAGRQHIVQRPPVRRLLAPQDH